MVGGSSGHFQLGEGTAKASAQAFKSAHEREMGLNRQDTVRACEADVSPEAMAHRLERVRHGPGKEHRSV